MTSHNNKKGNESSNIYISYVSYEKISTKIDKSLKDERAVVVVYPLLSLNSIFIHSTYKNKLYVFDAFTKKESKRAKEILDENYSLDTAKIIDYFNKTEITIEGNVIGKKIMIHDMTINDNPINQSDFEEIIKETSFMFPEKIYHGVYDKPIIIKSIKESSAFKCGNVDRFIMRSEHFVPSYDKRVSVYIPKIKKGIDLEMKEGVVGKSVQVI